VYTAHAFEGKPSPQSANRGRSLGDGRIGRTSRQWTCE
jgi:hypothetical protein